MGRMIQFNGCVSVEFNRFYLRELIEKGFTFFWAYGHYSKEITDESYHIFPLRTESPLLSFLERNEKMIFSKNDDELYEMADGIVGIFFMIHIPVEVFKKIGNSTFEL
jgi:hypothetical protein